MENPILYSRLRIFSLIKDIRGRVRIRLYAYIFYCH